MIQRIACQVVTLCFFCCKQSQFLLSTQFFRTLLVLPYFVLNLLYTTTLWPKSHKRIVLTSYGTCVLDLEVLWSVNVEGFSLIFFAKFLGIMIDDFPNFNATQWGGSHVPPKNNISMYFDIGLPSTQFKVDSQSYPKI